MDLRDYNPVAISCVSRCRAILGRLTTPYCPFPVDSALLTGQHGYYEQSAVMSK